MNTYAPFLENPAMNAVGQVLINQMTQNIDQPQLQNSWGGGANENSEFSNPMDTLNSVLNFKNQIANTLQNENSSGDANSSNSQIDFLKMIFGKVKEYIGILTMKIQEKKELEKETENKVQNEVVEKKRERFLFKRIRARIAERRNPVSPTPENKDLEIKAEEKKFNIKNLVKNTTTNTSNTNTSNTNTSNTNTNTSNTNTSNTNKNTSNTNRNTSSNNRVTSNNSKNECICANRFEPVCGKNNKDYLNECYMNCENIQKKHNGSC